MSPTYLHRVATLLLCCTPLFMSTTLEAAQPKGNVRTSYDEQLTTAPKEESPRPGLLVINTTTTNSSASIDFTGLASEHPCVGFVCVFDQGPQELVQNDPTYSPLQTVLDTENSGAITVHLRAYRGTACSTLSMNSTENCHGSDYLLSLIYFAEDNPELASLEKGRVYAGSIPMKALDPKNPNFQQSINMTIMLKS